MLDMDYLHLLNVDFVLKMCFKAVLMIQFFFLRKTLLHFLEELMKNLIFCTSLRSGNSFIATSWQDCTI